MAHIVLEKGKSRRPGGGRWDSFCLVTPNWSIQLPGHRYDGQDPDGFMPRDEVVAFLERYATGFQAPVREGVEVTSLEPGQEGRFRLETSAGEMTRRRWSSVPVRTSDRTGLQEPPRCPPTCFRSTSRTTGTPRGCLPARC